MRLALTPAVALMPAEIAAAAPTLPRDSCAPAILGIAMLNVSKPTPKIHCGFEGY
jgi:hypothetical protein